MKRPQMKNKRKRRSQLKRRSLSRKRNLLKRLKRAMNERSNDI